MKVKGKVSDQASYARSEELVELANRLTELIYPGDVVYVEAPPAAGSKNLQTFAKLNQMLGVVLCSTYVETHVIPVDTWKKDVIGKGGVSKEVVSSYLQNHYRAYSEACAGDQNLIDATCIALYGLKDVANGLDGS